VRRRAWPLALLAACSAAPTLDEDSAVEACRSEVHARGDWQAVTGRQATLSGDAYAVTVLAGGEGGLVTFSCWVTVEGGAVQATATATR
jgi:hypothetical protein